jgi:hypothetical protein
MQTIEKLHQKVESVSRSILKMKPNSDCMKKAHEKS